VFDPDEPTESETKLWFWIPAEFMAHDNTDLDSEILDLLMYDQSPGPHIVLGEE
jgi:hypothetical protein